MSFSFFRGCGLAALLTAVAIRADLPRLANLSSRGQAGAGANSMVTGFVIGPGTGDTILIRAVGPGLSSFGVAGVLPDPVLTLFDSGGAVLATNRAWSASDAGVMTAVGAFALTSGSSDCDLVRALPPGTYTAQVSSGGDTGTVLLELYEVSPTLASSHLINISNKVMVGTGSAAATNGFVLLPGTGNRTLLLRAIGPGLGAYGVAGTMADPQLALTAQSSGVVLASNDDWGTPVGVSQAGAGQLANDFAAAGAFTLPAGSTDAALEATLGAGMYTMNVTGKSGATGVALVEIYDLTPANGSGELVAVSATTAGADTSGSKPGVFTFTRSGDLTQAVNASYSVGGSAVAGRDYPTLSGGVYFAPGAASVTVPLAPNPTLATSGTTSVTVSLTSNAAYTIVGSGTATVTITPIAGTLFLAKLSGAAGSTAAGTATILLSPDGSLGLVNVAFSGLSSSEVVAHLVIGTPGAGTFVNLVIPYGQVTGLPWTFGATGSYSSSDLLAALHNGQIGFELDTQNFPTGELSGQFVTGVGSRAFVAPGPAPAVDLSKIAPQDASRFLTQATFGPTAADINAVMAQGYGPWIDAQMALPATSHLAATRADAAAYPNTGQFPIVAANRQEAWWSIAVNSQDQLRQRVAFALSEIFVVSDAASALANQPEPVASYYDLLARDAFGNWRQLIEDVTLSPVMGNYLNMLRNQPANAAKGTSADENYAREIMQLFTIGLNQLNPDGTLMLDASALPIPTYDQATIVQTANVFTGWAYHSTAANPNFTGGPADWYNPMQLYPAYHDNTAKTIVGGVTVPAGEGGAADLKLEFDTLFNHPTTGPFFARALIQRLVTSNPSPGYVYRVAQIFANDGSGVRGNLAAVVRAVLLDPEARSSALLGDASFGKLKEPLLRQTQIYRAFHATTANGRWGIGALFNPEQSLAQAALRSPTVFNFFLPDFVLPGPLAQAGLYAPEYQILTATTAISAPNYYYNSIYTPGTPAAAQPVLDLSALTTAPDTASLVGTLNLLLTGNTMSAGQQLTIVAALNALPAGTTAQAKAQYALYLVATTSAAAVQQ